MLVGANLLIRPHSDMVIKSKELELVLDFSVEGSWHFKSRADNNSITILHPLEHPMYQSHNNYRNVNQEEVDAP